MTWPASFRGWPSLQDPLAVEPGPGLRFARGRGEEGVFVFIVGKERFHAAHVKIHGFSRVFQGHGGGLQVPAGAHLAPGGGVVEALFQFRQLGPFQQGEIPGVFLGVLVQVHGFAHPDLAQVHPGEAPVVLEAGDVEIDRAQFFIGVALLQELPGEVDHVVDVVGGQGVEDARPGCAGLPYPGRIPAGSAR